jgi:hypothetical protein
MLSGTGRRGRDVVAPGSACASLFFALSAGSGAWARAIGSAGERLVHTEEVTGSIPVSPTTQMYVFHRLLGTTQLNLRQFGWALVPALALLVLWELGKLITRRPAAQANPSAATG